MKLFGRRYDTGEPVCVVVEGDRIADVLPLHPEGAADALPWIAPGLFDIQINGHGGTWFGGVGQDADSIRAALRPHFAHGITRMFPTLVTNSFEALRDGFAALREACEADEWVSRLAAGFHLEGPYISREDGPRGAHPLEHVRPADWDEFCQLQNAAGGRIRLVTLAPEAAGALEFIERAVDAGLVVAIGHTAAAPEQIQAAVDCGARLSTHLGNGAHGSLRRHPNYIWEQLGNPNLTASIITDGHHLPAAVMQSIIGAKSSWKTIITCDAAGLAGCPPGRYSEGKIEVEILTDGRIVIAGQDQLLAGSSLTTEACVAHAARLPGVGLRTAWDMASLHPARLFGLEQIRLQRGFCADLVQFSLDEDGRIHVQATVSAGHLEHGACGP